MNKNILNNPIVKGVLIIILTSLTTVLTNMPEDPHKWSIFWITLTGTVCVYIAQSFALPANSSSGEVNWRDIFKSVLFSIGNGITSYFATVGYDNKADWNKLGVSMLVLFLGYILKQWQTPAPKES